MHSRGPTEPNLYVLESKRESASWGLAEQKNRFVEGQESQKMKKCPGTPMFYTTGLATAYINKHSA